MNTQALLRPDEVRDFWNRWCWVNHSGCNVDSIILARNRDTGIILELVLEADTPELGYDTSFIYVLKQSKCMQDIMLDDVEFTDENCEEIVARLYKEYGIEPTRPDNMTSEDVW